MFGRRKKLEARVAELEQTLEGLKAIGANIGDHLNHGARISELESRMVADEQRRIEQQKQILGLTQAVNSVL